MTVKSWAGNPCPSFPKMENFILPLLTLENFCQSAVGLKHLTLGWLLRLFYSIYMILKHDFLFSSFSRHHVSRSINFPFKELETIFVNLINLRHRYDEKPYDAKSINVLLLFADSQCSIHSLDFNPECVRVKNYWITIYQNNASFEPLF